jgi:hypothetical protein
MSWNETEIPAACRTILKTAQRLSYVESARKIAAAGTTARLDERDTDLLLLFVGIVSETDALPFGNGQNALAGGCAERSSVGYQPKGRMGSRVWRTPLPKSRRALFKK